MSFSSFVSVLGMHAQRVKMEYDCKQYCKRQHNRHPDGSPGVYVKKNVTFKAIYQDKLGSTAPPFPSGDHEAYWSANNGTVALRGGITYDERNLAQGVQVEEITESKDPYKTIYDPSNPEADEEGYVVVPNINVVEEMVNMVSASRAYEANAATAETNKSMISAALRI